MIEWLVLLAKHAKINAHYANIAGAEAMQSVVVRKIETSADYKAFFEFPWQVYKEDPNWVPPLLQMRSESLDKQKNPAWSYMEGDYFGAWRGERLVGTIVAFINHSHNEFRKEHIGWFGGFECYNDPEVAQALLDTAAEWVKARGYHAIRGPQNFTTHDEVGVLVDNFSPPVVMMPYNPTYYNALISGAGYDKAMDVLSYYLDRKSIAEYNIMPRLARFTERLRRTLDVKIKPITLANLQETFNTFKDLYNVSWAENWGFSPLDERTKDELAKNLGPFLDLSLACIVELDDKPVGVMLPIPDLNQILHHVNPNPQSPVFWHLLKTMWHWKVQPKITGVRVALFGIQPEFRRKGLPMLLLEYGTLNLLKNPRYQYIDFGWVLETNKDIRGLLEMFGLKSYKTYRLYERNLL
jgi:GNAT superfamily N-acetyltransferase